ncbi:MAG: hypothetical protein HY901_17010 [Deltaproteobacteria bacterium]|nr:hypothetical protein [Deltaproteobacteria bacterium]
MGSSDKEWQKQLEIGLQRVQEALARDQRPHSQLLQAVVAAASAKALAKIQEGAQREQERRDEREDRRRLRAEARQRKREHEAQAGGPVGLVFAAFAAIALYFGLTRVDAVCARILSAIESGPPSVKEIVRRPQETLKALSATCRELARRERELRAAVTEDDERRLRAERDGLTARVAAEHDEVVRQRLGSALRALDAQLAQRSELGTAASRLEAEGTRILYTLENLHTQVLRARSADTASADVAGAGLRRSLEQLSVEIDAVATALESTHAPELLQPVVEVATAEGSTTDAGRQRTE